MKTTALLVALCLSSSAAMAPLSTKPAYMNGQVNGVTPSVATLERSEVTKLQKELLQSSLRPILLNLADYRKVLLTTSYL